MSRSKQTALPPVARAFVRTQAGESRRRLLYIFHCWLQKRSLTVQTAELSDIERFLRRPCRKRLRASTRHHYRVRLNVYLDWLYGRGHLRFDPAALKQKPKRLHPTAQRFVQSLTTIKPSSARIYRSSLLGFHEWLHKEGLSVTSIQRRQMLNWFTYLKDRGLASSTRAQRILSARCYLQWLAEQGHLRSSPDHLVRRADLPKRPEYLPRPLPPDVDHQLRRRLASSACPYQRGLLLMRNTGLRIGELRSLEPKCIRTDFNGNRFLKVPLGKLDNERLVPIDDETFNLIGELQAIGDSNRSFLLATARSKKTPYAAYTHALRDACSGLEIPDRMTTHRLRHTYATSLLNGGMSLVAVMKLLGHRDYRMTLRYTAITQETIVKEYYEALVHTEKRYAGVLATRASSDLDPAKSLSDIARWLRSFGASNASAKRATQALVKRLKRIQTVIQALLAKDSTK